MIIFSSWESLEEDFSLCSRNTTGNTLISRPHFIVSNNPPPIPPINYTITTYSVKIYKPVDKNQKISIIVWLCPPTKIVSPTRLPRRAAYTGVCADTANHTSGGR